MNDPLDRLISLSRQTPPPDPGEPPPFLHTRVMAALPAAAQSHPRRQWAALSLGSLPFAAAITALCAWQHPFSPASTAPAAPAEDSASLIASALIDSTIPQP